MFFTIIPFVDIGKNSFRISNHYLAKDNKENKFIGWAWEISYINMLINGKLLDESLPKSELRKIYNEITRGKISTIENRYLNKEGETLLYDIFNKLGSFKFSIYEDNKEPSNKIKFIDINDIKENILLPIDVTLLISDKDNPISKNIPLYHP